MIKELKRFVLSVGTGLAAAFIFTFVAFGVFGLNAITLELGPLPLTAWIFFAFATPTLLYLHRSRRSSRKVGPS